MPWSHVHGSEIAHNATVTFVIATRMPERATSKMSAQDGLTTSLLHNQRIGLIISDRLAGFSGLAHPLPTLP